MLLKSIIIFFLLPTALNKSFNWMQNLSKLIENEAKLVNQIVIIQSVHGKNEKWKIEDILFDMLTNYPSRVINFQSESVQDQLSKLSIDEPQTALFVLIHYQNENQDFSQLSEPINFVSNISKARTRPKCLIICFENGNSVKYGKLLRRMWSYDFLDVTVISILSVKTNYYLSEHDHQIRAIYHYNPHTNVTKKMRKLKFQLFPDKSQNLQKYPINVLFDHYPPEIFLPTNPLESKKISGINWLKIESLSKAMNFRIIINLGNVSSRLDCLNIDNSTGDFSALFHRKIEFHALEFQRNGACDGLFSEWAVGIIETNLALVVPVLAKESYVFNDKWAIFRFISTAGFPFIIWLILRLCRLQSKNLQLLSLIQIMLGFVVPREPQKSRDRIIFAVLFITSTLYSSMIYTALTDVGLNKQTTYSFETIDDVLSSNFSIVIPLVFLNLLKNFISNMSNLLLQKLLVVTNDPTSLIQQVYTMKNITCIVFSRNAKFVLQNQRDRCDMPIAKILENDYIARTISGTVMGARSPYVGRVNILLLRLIQSGVIEKWKLWYERKLSRNKVSDFNCLNRSMELQEIFWKIFFILIIGYSLSIFTFFLEMFVLYRLKYIARNFKMAKYLQRSRRQK